MIPSSSKALLASFVVAALLSGSCAYAADRVEAPAERTLAYAPQELGVPSIAVLAMNHRETNLRKTDTAIVVMGADSPRADRKRR